MFEDINQQGNGLLNGQLNLNDKEIGYMLDVYAQFGAGYDAKLNKTVDGIKTRKSLGEKLWEEMTLEDRKKEFFNKLKEDLEFTSKYVYDKNKINYFLDRASDPLDSMAGFYKILLVKLGATITEDGNVKVSKELRDILENNILKNKQVLDIVSPKNLNQSNKVNGDGAGLNLRLKLDLSV